MAVSEPVLLEANRSFVIIRKPEGLSFHSTDGKKGVLQVLRAMEDGGRIPSGERLYPVHRLDQVTSGILIFARGRKNANLLGNEFRHSRVKKIYIAISDRKPSKKQGSIIGDMEKGRGGAWILKRETKNPAITSFLSYSIPERRPGLRAYILSPHTGRTHQLRVAMKSLGAPILGDPMYGRYDLAREEERTYLHATGIRFTLGSKSYQFMDLPCSGEEFESEPFKELVNGLGDLFSLKFPGKHG